MELTKLINELKADEGVSYFTLEEFMKCFFFVCVASYRIDSKYSYVTIEKPQKNMTYYYYIEISKVGRYSFRLH